MVTHLEFAAGGVGYPIDAVGHGRPRRVSFYYKGLLQRSPRVCYRLQVLSRLEISSFLFFLSQTDLSRRISWILFFKIRLKIDRSFEGLWWHIFGQLFFNFAEKTRVSLFFSSLALFSLFTLLLFTIAVF